MGEYADDQFRKDVMSQHGFDPGSMYGEKSRKSEKVACKTCNKRVKAAGLNDHMRDAHGTQGELK